MNTAKHIPAFLDTVRLTAGLIMASLVLQSQPAAVIENDDHRPLAGALDKIEAATGVPVNYEDVPYENNADLEDVATPRHRVGNPTFRLLVPRKGRISAVLQDPGLRSVPDTINGVNALLVSYRNGNLPGDFKVEQANGMIYVVPAKVLGANGAVRDVFSPLIAPITVAYAERKLIDTVALILQAASKTSGGARIDVGNLPYSPTTMVAFSVSGESARDRQGQQRRQTLPRDRIGPAGHQTHATLHGSRSC